MCRRHVLATPVLLLLLLLFIPSFAIQIHTRTTQAEDPPVEDPPFIVSGTVRDVIFRNSTDTATPFDDDNTNFDIFKALLKDTAVDKDLENMLSLTVFAPDDASAKETAQYLRDIRRQPPQPDLMNERASYLFLKDWVSKQQNASAYLDRFVKIHIVPEKITRKGLRGRVNVKTLSGDFLNIMGGGAFIDDGNTLTDFSQISISLTNPGYEASNGIVHLINFMLLPPPTPISTPIGTPTPPASPSPIQTPTPTNRPSGASPTPNASDNSGECFPISASVHLPDGSQYPMSNLRAGQPIMTSEQASSMVYLFSHRIYSGLYQFVQITSAQNHTITLTDGHFIYANARLVAAGQVKLNDRLRTLDGETSVIAINRVVERGLIAPHTLHGDIVVNGIVASTYTTAIAPQAAHAVLWPVRLIARARLAVEPLGSLLYAGRPQWAKQLSHSVARHIA